MQRGPKYLFSGILKCGSCGGNFVVSGSNQGYTCATYQNGGKSACAVRLRVPRATIEERLLATIKKDLLSDEAVRLFADDMRGEMKTQRRETDQQQAGRMKRVAQLRGEIQNLTDAIAGGALRTSNAVAVRLGQHEAELAVAEQALIVDASAAAKVVDLLPRVAAQYRRMVDQLPEVLRGSVREARREIGALLGGEVRLVPDDTETHLVAHLALNRQALTLKCMGARADTRSGSGGRI